jgi:hypothetical protein
MNNAGSLPQLVQFSFIAPMVCCPIKASFGKRQA